MTEMATVYAGTYTHRISKGIYRFDFSDGYFTDLQLLCPIENAKYLGSYQDKLIAINDMHEGAGVSLITKEGKILDEKVFEKATSCYVTVHEDAVYTANYHEGTFSRIRIADDHFAEIKTVPIKDKGGCHQVLFHDQKILIPCLFLDKIMIYDQELNKTAEIAFPEGSGPRHGVFSEDGRYLYLVSELSNELFVIDTGHYEIIAVCPLLADGQTQVKGTAAVRMSPDGNHLYVSTRGRNVLSVFRVKDSQAELLQNVSCAGDHPRDFILLDGHLLCANMNTDEIVSFRLGTDGSIKEITDRIKVPEAVSLIRL